ncbi:MAG: hypothetical protein ABJO29_13945 [Yoonia sp.]|uniref:hypothetical protein n=1 Tax=Yoonia sp. TaxID=2212373 RepID=UPI003265A9BE
MYNASHVTMNSQFPLIQQDMIARLSAEADERLAQRLPKAAPRKSNWLTFSLSKTVLQMGWPFTS